jgi:hypothetical protein
MATKTNIEYLKEFIKDNKEALEFWEAVNEERKKLELGLKEARDQLGELEKINGNQDDEIAILQAALESDANLEKIDCGIGSIFYREPDNLQLQSLMEDFKEKHQITAR